MHRLFLLSYLLKIPFHPHVTLIKFLSLSLRLHTVTVLFYGSHILSYLQPVRKFYMYFLYLPHSQM